MEARVSRADTVKEVIAKICESENYTKESRKKLKKDRNLEL